MIQRKFPDLLTSWQGLVYELSYKPQEVGGIKWGVCLGYPDLVEVTIDDMLADNNLHLDLCSYTKSRWTRFLRRYFRTDLDSWVGEAIKKMEKYKNRPYVSSYSINLNPPSKIVGVGAHGGHNYGGCLSSLQIRLHPEPRVILYSRACQIDKIGFLDLTLMHLVAKRMGYKKVRGTWVISLGFISAVSQVWYVKRFKRPLRGHALQKRIVSMSQESYRTTPYGPLNRLFKRNDQWKELGTIPGSVPVRKLSLAFENAKE